MCTCGLAGCSSSSGCALQAEAHLSIPSRSKPLDDETNIDDIEKAVRGLTFEGLVWGASKKVDVAYGIQKLQIGCVVVDDLVMTDDVQEAIEAFDELVQSVDIASFQKL